MVFDMEEENLKSCEVRDDLAELGKEGTESVDALHWEVEAGQTRTDGKEADECQVALSLRDLDVGERGGVENGGEEVGNGGDGRGIGWSGHGESELREA
jgi:hypothetical protein